MTWIQILLVTFTDKKVHPFHPFQMDYILSTMMEKMVFLNFAARWDRTFDFKIVINVVNLCNTSPPYINPVNLNFCSLNDA